MLKISGSIESTIQLSEHRVGVGNNSRAGRNRSRVDGGEVDSNKIEDDDVKKRV